MKFINLKNICVFLYLISLVFSTGLNRIKNTGKSQDKEGSWNEGFLCSKLDISFGTQSGTTGEFRFYPKKFADPKIADIAGDDSKGLVMDFSADPGNLFKKFGVLINGNKYYIPWRYFKSYFKYENPWGSPKYIEGVITLDDKSRYTIRLNLPYKKIGYYINDDEGNKIKMSFSSIGQDYNIKIKDAKDNLTRDFSSYITNDSLLEEAKKDQASFTKKIEGMKKDLEKKKTDASSLDSQIQQIKSDIDKLYEQLKPLESKRDNLQSDYKVLTEEINSQEKSVNENSGQTSSKEELVKKYQPTVDESRLKVDSQVTALSNKIVDRRDLIENIKNAVTNKKSVDLKTNLDKINV